MKSWMKKLAIHYDKMRNLFPDDKLLILFDIDGTILDMRYMIFYLLKMYDKKNKTKYFKKLKVSDINVHENHLKDLLMQLKISSKKIEKIYTWCLKYRWTAEALHKSHYPFHGVMEVIRWFQMQVNTYVGLNTGRPRSIKKETLYSLNRLAKEYKVYFDLDLFYMNANRINENIADSKVEGIIHFQKLGYRVIAVVDNEPDNLKAVSEYDKNNEILLLHANTIFESKRKQLPEYAVSGKTYDITELIRQESLPRHIQFVCNGVNTNEKLKEFLKSNIQWAEFDILLDFMSENIITCQDNFEDNSNQEDNDYLILKDIVEQVSNAGKSIKLDLKANGNLLNKLLKLLENDFIDQSRLWFTGNIQDIREEGFRKLAKKYPKSIIQATSNFLSPLIITMPDHVKSILIELKKWGINRLSLDWQVSHLSEIVDFLDENGFDVDICSVPNLESFLKAVLLQPRSITSDFNFPKWNYFKEKELDKQLLFTIR